jgi:hypothetical protein
MHCPIGVESQGAFNEWRFSLNDRNRLQTVAPEARTIPGKVTDPWC